MIISIALGIVLAVIILRFIPFMVLCATLAGAVAYQVVRGLLKLSVQIVRGIARRIVEQLRAARYLRLISIAVAVSVVICLWLATGV